MLVLVGEDVPFVGILHMLQDGLPGVEAFRIGPLFSGRLRFWHQKEQEQYNAAFDAYIEKF